MLARIMRKKKPTYKELELRIRELEQRVEQKEDAKTLLPEEVGSKLEQIEREKEAILHIMTENLAYYSGKDLKIEWANRAYCESAGVSEKRVIGRYCYKIWHKRDKPCAGCHILEAFKTGKLQERETTALDGRKFQVKAFPVLDKNGEVDYER